MIPNREVKEDIFIIGIEKGRENKVLISFYKVEINVCYLENILMKKEDFELFRL